jgi:hypothetical protein
LVVWIFPIEPDGFRARRHDFANGQLVKFQCAVDNVALAARSLANLPFNLRGVRQSAAVAHLAK